MTAAGPVLDYPDSNSGTAVCHCIMLMYVDADVGIAFDGAAVGRIGFLGGW